MAIEINTPEQSKWVRDLLVANGWTGDTVHVRRVILDMDKMQVPQLYVEMYADAATFAIRPIALGAEIVRAETLPREKDKSVSTFVERERTLTDLCDRAYAALGLWESQGGNTQSTQLRHDLKAALGIISPGEPADGQADDDAKTTKTR